MGTTVILSLILVAVVVNAAIAWANNTIAHGCSERLDKINPEGGEVVAATLAMSLDAEGKRAIEDWIYDQCKENEEYRNVSRDDIRAVQHWLGVKARRWQPGQLVAQAREMQNWVTDRGM
jgi:hypothetical protein